MSQLNHSESAYLQMELKQQIANTLVSLLYVGALLVGLLLGIQSVMAGRLTGGGGVSGALPTVGRPRCCQHNDHSEACREPQER